MIKILFSWLSIPRAIGIWIDSIAFSLVDNLYDLIVEFSTLEFFSEETIKSIMQSTYTVISIFALFRIAIILVNAIINPDKLTDSKNGFLPVLRNFVLMFVLLVLTPRLFTEAYKIQSTIVEGNYIQKLFLRSSAKTENPGDELKKIVISSLVYPDKTFATYDVKEGKYIVNKDCDGNCEKAVNAYNDDVLANKNGMFVTLSKYIGTSKKIDTNNDGDKETVYVYNYMFFVTFAAGIFITYVLASMGLDIAIRAVELAVLQIISPLFIVTMIDPKSVQSGPFKKWLQTVGKTYVSLFIKIAILTLMIKLISIVNTASLPESLGFLGKLVAVLAILIFAKKAPKWIGDMVGVEGDSAGLGGLGKKLGSAALVGGAISKGLDTAKKFGAQKGKNFLGNRVRNTSARVGAMKEAHKANKELKNYPNSNQKKQSLWQSGRAAAKLSKANNYGKDSEGLLKDIAGGYMAGRMNINPKAESLSSQLKKRAEKNANDYNEKIGNTQEAIQKRREIAENNAEAEKLYKNVAYGADGDRLMVKGPNGENVYVNPRGTKELNQAIGNATTELGAFEQIGTNMVNGSMGKISLNGSGQVIDTSGKVIANSAADYALQNMDLKGKLAIKSVVASNVEKDIHAYENSLQQINVASKNYTDAMGALNDATQKLSVNSDYQNAQNVILKTESLVKQRDDVNNAILKIKGNSDYQYLSNQEYSKLSPEEQNRLATYNTQYKEAVTNSNNLLTEINKEKQNYTNAISVKNQIENQTGIAEFREKCEDSKKQLDAWKSNAEEYENKFKTTEVYKIDDDGKISGSKENPYEVKIDGKTYNPADPNSMIKFQEIKDIISTKASKAKNKYDKSMEDKK